MRTDAWDLKPEDAFSNRLNLEEEQITSNNWILWAMPLVLSIGGVVMIVSLFSKNSPGGREAFYGLFVKQCVFLGIGFLFMVACSCLYLSWIRRMSWFVWFLAILMAYATLIPGIGVKAGGATRWLNLGFVTLQPLEILTVAVPLFLADRLPVSRREGWKCFWKPSLFLAILSALPIFLQPNKGGTILILGICMSMHVVNRGWKWPLLGALPLGVFFFAAMLLAPYSLRRWMAFLNPWDDPLGRGYQIIQGLIAFSNGGLGGVGVGKGLQKQFLPAAHTDYIFPSIGEEFGLVGTLLVVSIYAVWTVKSYLLYRRSNDPYISLLIWGMTVSILFPMFINLGGVMKLMPLTGIPLPFLSAGGSAMISMWVKVGILVCVGKELTLREMADGSR
jgi:cell division protein FtsW